MATVKMSQSYSRYRIEKSMRVGGNTGGGVQQITVAPYIRHMNGKAVYVAGYTYTRKK